MSTMDELPAKTTMSKRKSHDVSFKLKTIGCAEKTSEKAAAREMVMDSKRIREWCTTISFSTEPGAQTLTGGHAAPTMTHFILKTMLGIRQKIR